MPMHKVSFCPLSQPLQCIASSVHQAAFLKVDTLSMSVVWHALPLMNIVVLPSGAEFNFPGRALRLQICSHTVMHGQLLIKPQVLRACD